ncbi:unnamed protein product [Arctogadus glacialis]
MSVVQCDVMSGLEVWTRGLDGPQQRAPPQAQRPPPVPQRHHGVKRGCRRECYEKQPSCVLGGGLVPRCTHGDTAVWKAVPYEGKRAIDCNQKCSLPEPAHTFLARVQEIAAPEA